MNNKGFTLIEVLAVIVIIAIVGMVAVPGVLSLINTSKDSSYETMIDNIRTAAEEMYQELEYFGKSNGNKITNEELFEYDIDGKTNVNVGIIVSDKTLEVNLQTLVGNGFLSGSSNNKNNDNKNKKIILEPHDNEDIGFCEVKITKVIGDNNKVCYKIEGTSSDSKCPTTDSFGGDSQCTS